MLNVYCIPVMRVDTKAFANKVPAIFSLQKSIKHSIIVSSFSADNVSTRTYMTTARHIILAWTLAVFGLIACNNSNQQNNLVNETSTIDTLTNVAPVSNDIYNDTISYDYSYFPIDSLFETKVLTNGTFHGDEVWNNADKLNWFGLFKGMTGFYIAETKLITKRVNDPILDANENDKTGWEVHTLNKDTSIILIESSNFLKPHNVQQAILSKEQLFPGDTLQINYLGIDYKIYATGGKKKVQDSPEYFNVWNYKLYLTATIKGQQNTCLLVAQPNFDDQMIKLIFAGDIDGDGILDLIIDTSRHYDATSPTIYLSKPANNREVLKPVGRHTSVGC